MKFTFKRHPKPTGLAGVANPYQHVDVKYKGKRMGQIVPPSTFSVNKWRAGFIVEDGKSWKWVFFARRFDSEQEARDYFQSQIDFIFSHEVYFLED